MAARVQVDLRRDGVVIDSTIVDNASLGVVFVIADTPAAGWHTYSITMYPLDAFDATAGVRTLVTLLAKK